MADPTYTYTLCTPDAASPMNQTQPLILENFEAINEFVDMNHVGFNVDNFGKHNQTLMPFVDDIPNARLNTINVFTQSTPDGSNLAEIFMQYPTGRIRQLSGGTSLDSTADITYGTGWIKFPSGIICKYGTYNFYINGGDILYNGYYYFPTGDDIPVFTTVAYAKVSPTSNTDISSANAWANNPTVTIYPTYLFGANSFGDLYVDYFCIGI